MKLHICLTVFRIENGNSAEKHQMRVEFAMTVNDFVFDIAFVLGNALGANNLKKKGNSFIDTPFSTKIVNMYNSESNAAFIQNCVISLTSIIITYNL